MAAPLPCRRRRRKTERERFMSIKVLLADDHRIMREGLRSLIDKEPDMKVVGEASDGRKTVRMAEELSPDVAVVDITMPELNGIEATGQIVNTDPEVKVLALSMHSDEHFIMGMLRAGACLEVASFVGLARGAPEKRTSSRVRRSAGPIAPGVSARSGLAKRASRCASDSSSRYIEPAPMSRIGC